MNINKTENIKITLNIFPSKSEMLLITKSLKTSSEPEATCIHSVQDFRFKIILGGPNHFIIKWFLENTISETVTETLIS